MLLLTAAALFCPPQDPAVTRHERALPELGVTILDERRIDAENGRVQRHTLDAAGRPVDADALRAAEIAARDARAGKLHSTLVERLAQPGPVEVAFWLREPLGMPDLRGAIDDACARGVPPEDARRLALALAERTFAAGNAAFAAAAAGAGGVVTHVDRITPVVFVRADAATIRALALRDDVDRAYESMQEWFPESCLDEEALRAGGLAVFNDWASKTARTDAVHRRGITGAGVKVLVNDTGGVATTNPYLPPVVSGLTGSIQAHATAVAGIICSNHVPHTGAAPGLAQIYSYHGASDANAQVAWAWGMAQGISYGNCSWWNGQKGQIQFLDRYFDYIIRHFAVMLFKSAGNQGGGDGKITTPGCGYNMIASGNSNDANTWDWNDDSMNSSSSWVNPLEGHDKPEVTAAGTTITTTTTSSPWIGAQGSGTSYASPVTCGVAALLAQTDPSLLTRPEAVKALLMAGAFHNIEGAARLSDRDGAGHIDAAASQMATAKGQYVSTTLTAASFDAAGNHDVQVSLVRGDETRICAVWFSLANSSYSTDVLQMDLDLTVWFGSTLIASSASAVNPFEIVQFVPPATGDYTVRLQRQTFLGTSEPFALAWVTRRDAATNEVIATGSPVPGGQVDLEFIDRYHPGASYLAVLSLTPFPATLAVGPKKVLEFGFDVATDISLTMPGFAGSLNSSGRAYASFVLPPFPWLTGWTLYAGMVSLDWSLPEIAEETSPPTAILIQ